MPKESYHNALNQALHFFVKGATGGYVFASATDQRLIRSFNEDLTDRAKARGRTVSLLFLRSKADEPVMEQIRRAAAQSDSLIIGNLDELINENGADLLLHLNFSREPLQALQKPILIWVTEAHFPLLAKRAPDLFSQRALPSFHIGEQAAPAPKRSAERPAMSVDTSPIDSATEAESQALRIKWLKRQLQEAEQEGLPASRIANHLALPLVQAYLAKQQPERAFEIFERYRQYVKLSMRGLLEMGRAYQEAGLAVEALEHYKQAENANGQSPSLLQASLYDEMATAYQALGLHEEAAGAARQALSLKRQLLQPDSHDLVVSYQLLADALCGLDRFDEAEQAERDALALIKQQATVAGSETGSAYHRLARLYLSKGALESALEYAHKALGIYDGLPGFPPKERAALLSQTAAIYEQMGDIEQALHYQGEALSLLQSACPEGHECLTTAQRVLRHLNEQLPTQS